MSGVLPIAVNGVVLEHISSVVRGDEGIVNGDEFNIDPTRKKAFCSDLCSPQKESPQISFYYGEMNFAAMISPDSRENVSRHSYNR